LIVHVFSAAEAGTEPLKLNVMTKAITNGMIKKFFIFFPPFSLQVITQRIPVPHKAFAYKPNCFWGSLSFIMVSVELNSRQIA
jgi:hypothetical protein